MKWNFRFFVLIFQLLFYQINWNQIKTHTHLKHFFCRALLWTGARPSRENGVWVTIWIQQHHLQHTQEGFYIGRLYLMFYLSLKFWVGSFFCCLFSFRFVLFTNFPERLKITTNVISTHFRDRDRENGKLFSFEIRFESDLNSIDFTLEFASKYRWWVY